ncbi:hypothetical protein GF312_22250 [Candidatus Poribacteria bacterium]|nr:hypothetical protein [Candidatus Poribacteria bacterium]
MIYSEECIDPTAGFDLVDTEHGVIQKPRKLGYWVLTAEEALEIMRNRGESD